MPTESLLFWIFFGTLLHPVLHGLMGWRHMAPQYRPMIVFIWTVYLLQVIERFINLPEHVNEAFRYFEPLIQWILIAWQARRLHIFKQRPGLIWVMLSVIFIAPMAERLWWADVAENTSLFSVATSFMITVMGIEMLTSTMISSTGKLFSNPISLFSMGLIFYYTFSGLLDLFMIIGQYSDKSLLYKAYYSYIVLGIFTNIFYIRSFVCIPTKTSYSVS